MLIRDLKISSLSCVTPGAQVLGSVICLRWWVISVVSYWLRSPSKHGCVAAYVLNYYTRLLMIYGSSGINPCPVNDVLLTISVISRKQGIKNLSARPTLAVEREADYIDVIEHHYKPPESSTLTITKALYLSWDSHDFIVSFVTRCYPVYDRVYLQINF